MIRKETVAYRFPLPEDYQDLAKIRRDVARDNASLRKGDFAAVGIPEFFTKNLTPLEVEENALAYWKRRKTSLLFDIAVWVRGGTFPWHPPALQSVSNLRQELRAARIVLGE